MTKHDEKTYSADFDESQIVGSPFKFSDLHSALEGRDDFDGIERLIKKSYASMHTFLEEVNAVVMKNEDASRGLNWDGIESAICTVVNRLKDA